MSTNIKIAFEAIEHQYDSLLFKQLNGYVTQLMNLRKRDWKKESKEIVKCMEKSIFAQTGIDIEITVPHGLDMCVEIPTFYRNSPLYINIERALLSEDVTKKKIWEKNTLKGTIDREKGRIGGVFSEIKSTMYVGNYFLNKNGIFNSEEVAAAMLHELGHVFTSFEFLSYQITTNFIVSQTTRKMLELDDQYARIHFLKEVEKTQNIHLENKEYLSVKNSDTTVKTILLSTVMKERQHELGSPSADLTAWESLSDQFASRHGAGMHVLTLLDKLYRNFGSKYVQNKPSFYFFNMVGLLSVLILPFFVPAFLFVTVIVFLLSLIPNDDIYDDPIDRAKRIRRDMVDSLKNRNVPDQTRRIIESDIKQIDLLIEGMNKNNDILSIIWDHTLPYRRKRIKQLTFQQDIESALNNDFYLQASRVKAI